MARYGIVVDLNRCTGCMTCVLACKQENLTGPGIWWNKVLDMESETLDSVLYARYACMHCDKPPCVEACPERAIYKRPDGIVLIDQGKCRGHGECIKACPYGVIEKNHSESYFSGLKLSFEEKPETFRIHHPGKATKCTLCVHRIADGREPACVAGCPSRAMTFADLDNPETPVREKLRRSKPLLPGEKTDAKVSYIIPAGFTEVLEKRIIEDHQMVRD
jgi:molybdopterin-containing oxidoreductase family iron-sulfur binding subunit